MIGKTLARIAVVATGTLLADAILRLGGRIADFHIQRMILQDLEKERVAWLESLGGPEDDGRDWDEHLQDLLEDWKKKQGDT